MSRIWRRIPLMYSVKHEPLIWARFNISRCVHTTTSRFDSPKENEENNNESSKTPPPKSHLSADKLLSTLTGLKVMKNLDSKVGRSPRFRSAAADFLQLKEKKPDEVDSSSDDVQSPEVIQKMVLKKVSKVAEIFPEKEVVESDLLKQLRRHDEATAAGQQGDLDAVGSILSGLKVQKQSTLQQKAEHSMSDERVLTEMLGNQFGEESRRRSEKPEPYKRQQKRTLFDRQRLNFFKVPSDRAPKAQALAATETDVLTLWDKEEKKRLRELSHSTINHGFEEMIKWTEEGKLWHYPIDNEQGLEEEQAVAFHEHVFFDHLLEDLPQIEPIVNFMELVCVGLSKNPYLTVQQKHDHIEWFKKYFTEREAVIKEALEAEKADEARGLVV